MEIEPARIEATYAVIAPHLRKTPVLECDLSDGLPAKCVLKLEQLQRTGSFKARGAFANLLMREIPKVGVVAASGGNHGAAVAFAAMKLGIPARIHVPAISSPAKIARIREYGADLVVNGEAYDDVLKASMDWETRTGALGVHAFDQTETILGQATLALEFERQTERLDTILVSVGGGGLIAGIAAWFGGRTKVVGVEPQASPTLANALAAGTPVDAPEHGLAADSLAPRRVGEIVFPIARTFVDHVVLVTDEDIRGAQKALWDKVRVVAEPGGATAFAALVSGLYKPKQGERVGVVISGGNTTAVDFDH